MSRWCLYDFLELVKYKDVEVNDVFKVFCGRWLVLLYDGGKD